MKDDLLKLAPMTEYQAPELPTLNEAEPELLQKVPKRWKNKAVMATAVGLLGATALTGCGNSTGSFTPIEETGNPMPAPSISSARTYCSNLHHGGSIGNPIYVAHFTETDALNIINQQFLQAGIKLDEALPRPRINAENIHYEIGNWGEVWSSGTMFPNYLEVQLVHEDSGVGIVLIKNWYWWLGSPCTTDVRRSIEQRFLNEHGMNVEVIFETGEQLWSWGGQWDLDWDEIWTQMQNGIEITEIIGDEIRTELLKYAETSLTEQVDIIINQLRNDGVTN